ncbi:MAG: patatin-like phospholipase family protein [Pseudomonadota bacterium]
MSASKPTSRHDKVINLGLQGGGAHGAFAWGVLDRLLEDGRLGIEAICATSAGTMNACALAYGDLLGGPERARETLHDFWWRVHRAGQLYSPVKRLPWEKQLSWNMDTSVAFFLFDSMTRMWSPYQLNPFDVNPLRDVLADTVDFEALRRCQRTQLFISATSVRTGKVKVFPTDEITLDVAMASACLPYLFKAVTIDGEDYWDGGYMGNPALFPLFYKTQARDIVVVHINPMERADTPRTAPDIMNRVNEISFNASLLKEMRAIAFVKRLLDNGMLKDEYRDQFKNVLLHSVRADAALCDLSVASKFDSDWDFLVMLRDRGRETMAAWLDQHYTHIGVRDTVHFDNARFGEVIAVPDDAP